MEMTVTEDPTRPVAAVTDRGPMRKKGSCDVMTTRLRHRRGAMTGREGRKEASQLLHNTAVLILSGVYGILLVVPGLVIPITEALCSARQIRTRHFQVFYIYLYGVSMVFMAYVHLYLLPRDASTLMTFSRSVSRIFRRGDSVTSSQGADTGATPTGSFSRATSVEDSRPRPKKIVFLGSSSGHTSSFYLRIGAIGFGIGSVIHSFLSFSRFFEMSQSGQPCRGVLPIIKPLTHACFTFGQMYFVFKYSKICVVKHPNVARFGLMHMCGTNICVWLRVIVVETLHIIKVEAGKSGLEPPGGHVGHGGHSDDNLAPNASIIAIGAQTDLYESGASSGHLPELKCYTESIMGRVIESSSVYLFPCTIQYSLICAGVLSVVWSNVGGHKRRSSTNTSVSGADRATTSAADYSDDRRRPHRISMDCAGSSQGLFLGLAVFVTALCCLIWFYAIVGDSDSELMAKSLIGHISEDLIYVITLIATIIAALQMRKMRFSHSLDAGIEEILTIISLSGLGLFAMFSLMASIFYLDTMDGKLTILTNVIMLVQAGSQATFILAALRVSAIDDMQASRKPGRNSVTFLMISNFTLWVMNTFETQSLEHNVVQVDFYGSNAWSIFSHISVPLGLYFRFHSAVCLSSIWKNAWKSKTTDSRSYPTRL